MAHILCDIIIDFETTDPINDIRVARSVLQGYEKQYGLAPGSFQLEEAKPIPMGWWVAKLFLTLEFAQKLHENNSDEIERAHERMRTYKFLVWLQTVIGKGDCKGLLKYAEDMKNTGGGNRYSSQFITIYSDEFSWSR